MKAVGILILLTMSVMTGCIAAHGLKIRVDKLRCMRRMTEAIRLMIRYEALETDEIVRRLVSDKGMDELGFLKDIDTCHQSDSPDLRTFSERWECAACSQEGITDNDKAVLYRIGSFLGTCDCEGQNSALELAARDIDRLLEEASGQYAAKGKLYRSLGAVAGALLAVITV